MEIFEELDTSVISFKEKSSKEVYNLLSYQREYTYLPPIITETINSWEIYYIWQVVDKHILRVRFLIFKMRTSQSNKDSKLKNITYNCILNFGISKVNISKYIP